VSVQLKGDQDLEECVIEAVGSGYLDARIEQNERIVYIQYVPLCRPRVCLSCRSRLSSVASRRVTTRFFDDASWARLGYKLDAWKVNLRNALSTIQTSRAQGGNKKYDEN